MGKQLLKAILFTGLIFISWNFYAQTKGIKLSDLKPISTFFEANTVEEEIVPEINSTPKEIRNEILKVEETFACNITLDSDAGTDNQTICEGGTIDQIDYSVDGGGTISVSNLPNGLFTIESGGAITIIGTPTESGTFTISASGGTCAGTEEVTGTITLDINSTADAGPAIDDICQGDTSDPMGGSIGGGATGGVWSGGAGTWTNANDPAIATYTADPTESGPITLTLTSSGGSCGTTTATKTITVNEIPTADPGAALTDICQGDTSDLMGGSIGGGATGGTWSGGAGTWNNANDPTNATYTAGPAESGTITLTLTSSGGSCGTTTATKTITVNENPTADAGPAMDDICQGETSVAMGGSVGGGATGGIWSGGAGTWTNANDPANATYTADPSESGTITLTLETIGGDCGNISVAKDIIVNQNPIADAGVVMPDICQGETSVAMGGSVGGGATGGVWSGGAGTWTNANDPANATYTADPSESGTITLTLETIGGDCGNISVTKDIIVNQNPIADAGVVMPDICQGETSVAMGGSVGGGATGGVWSGGSGTWTNANDPANATYTAGPAESGTITLTLETIGGDCGTISVTKEIIVNQNPTADAGVVMPDICQGETSVAMGGSVGGGATGGTWSGGAGTWTNANDPANATYTADPSESGTITLTLETIGGNCGTISVTKDIVVNTLPIPTFEEEPLGDVCVGTSVTYTTQSGSGESNYVWSIQGILGTDYTITSGGTSTTDPTVTLTWLTEGSKDVYVYYANSNNCTPINSAYNNITVNPLPVPTFEEAPGLEACEQDALTYTTQAGQSDYIWNIPGTEGTDYVITAGGIGDANESVTIQWLTTGSKTVTVSYTDSVNGCIASSTASSTTEVEPFASVGPTSVAYPSVCISSPTLTPFTQATTGVTAIGTPVGLPDGISASFDPSTGLITFSGTATTPTIGAQSYSIPLIGDCINGLEATGTIEVSPNYTLTSVTSVSATTIGGSATITMYGDPTILSNGTYEVVYEIAEGAGSFTQVGPVNVSVNNGKGSFLTNSINDNTETYTVKILSLKKTTDQCTITLPDPPTTYFGICAAVFSANSTFTVPANVYSITIELYGGGGGGGKGNSAVGGGGGAYSIRTDIPVTPGEPLGVFVGAGGTENSNGGMSYVTRDSNIADQQGNSLVYAEGGYSGLSTSPVKGESGKYDTRHSGEDGTNSVGNKGGNGGGPLGGLGGSGGSSGTKGNSPGGGGGSSNGTGYKGGNGLIVISYSCPDPDDTDCINYIDDGAISGTTVIEFICDDIWNAPEGLSEFTVLVGSGGGGGGGGEGSGGGGSGTLILQSFATSNPYGLPAGSTFNIGVGEGGPGASFSDLPGYNGESSSFDGIIDGSVVNILVPGGGGGGSRISNPGGDGASGGGGGADSDPDDPSAGTFGSGGNPLSITYSGSNAIVYQGNVGGNGDFSEPQNSIAGGGGGGLVPWGNGNDGQHGKAAGNGQGEGGRGGHGLALSLGDSLRYFGAGGGGIGEYFNGTEKIGEGGISLLDGTKLGGDGNLDILNTNGIGYPGKDQTGSGGGAGYAGGGRGGDGVVYIYYYNFKILQVEYLYFEAKFDPDNRNGQLSWATSKEWANAKFEIERSIGNANNWEKIGEVAGQGYKDSQTDYTFTDTQLPAYGGNIFYRLKQVDFEDTFTYSVTRAIQVPSLKGSSNWIIYPNPSELRSNVTVGLINPSNYHDEPIIVRISDVRGINVSYSANSIEEVNQAVNSYLETAISGMHIVQLIWGDQSEQLKLIRK